MSTRDAYKCISNNLAAYNDHNKDITSQSLLICLYISTHLIMQFNLRYSIFNDF